MSAEVVLLALCASCFTALASVAQHSAASPASEDLSLSWRLIGFLLGRPVWFVGIACMILGFLFQVDALRYGALTLVQSLIGAELVLVFGIVALKKRGCVRISDWVAAAGIASGLGVFLTLADPRGGSDHAGPGRWLASALVVGAIVVALAAFAHFSSRDRGEVQSAQRAALFGVAAATGFGFVAAVIKELSSHIHQGVSGLFLNWSPYALIIGGAVAMFLASNAFQAGPLSASQPALTLVDPVVASLLGVFLFGDHLNLQPQRVLAEGVAICIVGISVAALSRSPLVQQREMEQPDPASSLAPPSRSFAS